MVQTFCILRWHMHIGNIHSFETFGSVDGPGVRFVVFMQGCRMRCKYCHNPDSWKMDAGQQLDAQQVLDKALRYKSYWGDKGGITVSGGEPLLQMEFVTELFTLAQDMGIHTTLDTSGAPFNRDPDYLVKFNALMDKTSLVMLDIKHIDPKMHLELTKCPLENILDMAAYLDELKKDVWIRHVLVDGYTNDETYLRQTADFLKTLSNVRRVEILPYHSFGMYKWEKLSLPYELTDVATPTDEQIARAGEILNVQSYADYKKD